MIERLRPSDGGIVKTCDLLITTLRFVGSFDELAVLRLSDEELARKFHDNAVRSLPEERAAEFAARTLALPDAQSVEDLTALLTSARERRGRDSYRSRTA